MLAVGAAAALAAAPGSALAAAGRAVEAAAARRQRRHHRPRALVSGRNLAARAIRPAGPGTRRRRRSRKPRPALAEAIDAGVATTTRRPLLEIAPHTDRDLVLGVLLALDKTGTRFAVRPFGPFRLGGHWKPDGTEDAHRRRPRGRGPRRASGRAPVSAARSGLFAYLLPPYNRPFGDPETDADEEGRHRGRGRGRRVGPDRLRPGAGRVPELRTAAPSSARRNVLLIVVEGSARG